MIRFGVFLLAALAVPATHAQSIGWDAVERMVESAAPGAPALTTDSLAARLRDTTQRRPVLLDARSAEEYAVSHLPGALRVDPEATAFPQLDTLAADAPIVVYCSVGVRSAKVTQRLRRQGFTNAANLRGSIFRWANEGRTVVRDGTPVEAVHPYSRLWGLLLKNDLHAYAPEDASNPQP